MPRTFRRPVDLLVMIWRTPNANLLRHTNSPDDEIFMINDINIYYKTLIIYDRFIAKILLPFLKKLRRGKGTKKNKQQNHFTQKIIMVLHSNLLPISTLRLISFFAIMPKCKEHKIFIY